MSRELIRLNGKLRRRETRTEDQIVSRAFGDDWLHTRRSAVLLVPSMVLRGREHNVLINPEHPDFGRIAAREPQDVQWDRRLFIR